MMPRSSCRPDVPEQATRSSIGARFVLADEAVRPSARCRPGPHHGILGGMESSTKHVIATLVTCAAIVAVTAAALVAMSPVP
ncbi:hypothetical protein NS330_03755 [Curtobacterium citreum]|nr:hypothetical protein NS330_03755 [Curtobacterium citreum]